MSSARTGNARDALATRGRLLPVCGAPFDDDRANGSLTLFAAEGRDDPRRDA